MLLSEHLKYHQMKECDQKNTNSSYKSKNESLLVWKANLISAATFITALRKIWSKFNFGYGMSHKYVVECC